MIKRSLFESLGGFPETNECFEDVLLNLNCLKRHRQNILLGDAVCYHHESITRVKNKNKQQAEIDDYNQFVIPEIKANYKIVKDFIIKL